MSRLQEVESLIDNNFKLVIEYTKRAAELMRSIRSLEKEREKIMKNNRKNEIVKDET